MPADGRSLTPSLPHVEVAQSPVAKFKEFLELKRLKTTDERLQIVEHIFTAHEHFDVEQLLASMKTKGLSASRPTVYRTLNLLVDSGLLRRLTFGGVTAYEHDYGYPRHEHLFCERCGGVIEFVSDEIERLLDAVARQHRFRMTARKIVVNGVCEKCARPSAHRGKLDLI